MVRSIVVLTAMLGLLTGRPAAADEVHFLNGDRLTGKIVSAEGGKLILRTEAAGDITIDLTKVKTFSTEEPVRLKVHENPIVEAPVIPLPEGGVAVAPSAGAAPEALALEEITAINPPAPAWAGLFSLNGLLTTGNSETGQLGFSAWMGKRWEADRLSLGAQYYYGRQEDLDTGRQSTTLDYGLLYGKHDHFLTKKLYLFGLLRLERDGVAALDVRFTPSAGVGYQWFEDPTLKFSTEAGLAWVYQRYDGGDTNEYFAARLAYAISWTPVTIVTLYHTLEYLPSFEGPENYLLNVDAGVRTTIWKGLFSEFRIEFRYNSEPASDRETTDVRYFAGVGWQF